MLEGSDEGFYAATLLLQLPPQIVLKLRLGEEVRRECQRLAQAYAELNTDGVSPVQNARERRSRNSQVLGEIGHAPIPHKLPQ